METHFRRLQPVQLLIASSVGIFAFAFIAAPYSCEWGLASYTWLGLAALLMLLIAPFVLSRSLSVGRRMGQSVGFAALFLGVWMLGIVVANVRIMCRLF